MEVVLFDPIKKLGPEHPFQYGRVLILHHVATKYDKTLDKQKCAKVAHGLQNVC